MKHCFLVAAMAASALCAVIAGCTDPEQEPQVEISAEPKPAFAPPAANAQLTALDAAIEATPSLAADLADVRAMLAAEDLERKGDQKDAVAQWLTALRTAKGRFGKRALDGWIKAYVKALGKKSDRVVLTRLLLAETQSGSVSPYMTTKGLTTDVALLSVVEAQVPEWLTDDPTGTAPGVEPPRARGIPADDPLLIATAQANCKAGKNRLDSWQAWVGSLGDDVKLYWNALVQQCAGQAAEAADGLKVAAARLAKARATHALAVEAVGRAAGVERAIGKRTEAADTYLDLVKYWDLPGVSPATMGIEEPAFSLRRIDEVLWASRYRSLVADYENAKVHAQGALNLISNLQASRPGLSQAVKEQIATLRAEAYHVLAYRVALELREFESAAAMNVLALQTPHLNREWRERLAWFAGVYEYLSNHHESAKKKWEALLAQTKDDSMRAMLYFWLAKVYDHLGKKAESRFYLTALSEDYPLSFYATVAAPKVAKLDGIKDWRRLFGQPQALARKLEDGGEYGIDKIRRQGELGRLLRRAEALTGHGIEGYDKIAVDELDTAMGAELAPETHAGAYVYLTRLQYETGGYLKAIGLTTRLAKAIPNFWQQWPEQLLIYFPRPYAEEYTRNAAETSLDKSLLLGISRQESGFTPDIRSSANALGLMQLIQPTAVRFAKEAGLDASDLDGLLKNPAANIKMGSRYLKFLSLNYNGFEPAIYGGYNAGEYAVDLWLKRRAHSDPLMFIELVPFGETKDYIKNVWRNVAVYQYLETEMPGGLPRLKLRPNFRKDRVE